MSDNKNIGETPIVTAHAAKRWAERAPCATVDVETAWTDGIIINAPECDCDSARLYPPQDALIIQKNARIVTVLSANYARLDTTGIVWCSNCGCATKLQRSWDRCEWCESQAGMEHSDGNIQVLS